MTIDIQAVRDRVEAANKFPRKTQLTKDAADLLALLDEAGRLIETLVKNDPDDAVADGGATVYALWRGDAEAFLRKIGVSYE